MILVQAVEVRWLDLQMLQLAAVIKDTIVPKVVPTTHIPVLLALLAAIGLVNRI